MAAPPKSATLDKSDFKGQEEWIDRLLRPLNAFFKGTSSALSALSLEQNVTAQVERIVLNVGDDISAAFPAYVANKMDAKPRLVLAGRIESLTDPNTVFPSFGSPTWDIAADGRIKIRYVPGLVANHKLAITLLVLP